MWITVRLYAMHRTEGLSAYSILFLVFTVGLYGCSGGERDIGIEIEPTVQVTGKVLVDGEAPEMPIRIKAHLVGNADKNRVTAGATGEGGAFELSTYNKGDGIPPGEYKLTFVSPSMNFGGIGTRTDALGGQYSAPLNSQFTVTVTESDETQDLGVFELKKAAEPTVIPDDRIRTAE
jgi:hypothetical protein